MRLQFQLIYFTVFLFYSTLMPVRGQTTIPDLIFYNGTILTIEKDQAQALAIQGDKILAIGSDEEILAMQGVATQKYDLKSQTLMPGFVDAHTHIFNDAEASLQEAQQLALENGITTLGDMYVPPEFLEQMRSFEQEGNLRIRTSLYMINNDNCGNVVGDWYKNYPPTREPGELLRIGGVKIFSDGGTCGRRAALSFPRPNGDYGDLYLDQAQLDDAVSQAHDAGYQVVIHAIGDSAVKTAQNAIEFALNGESNTLRHRIDHNWFIRPDLLKRYGEIGIVTVLSGWYETCAELAGQWAASLVGSDRLSWISPHRALLDNNPGLHVAWHGDDPWIGPISPILELHSFVTREEFTADGTACKPPEWLAATTITAEEALRMMTIGAAYALFRDEEVGSLELGKYADLVLLSDNPLAVEPDSIKDIQVLMTMIGGRVEFGSFPTEVIETDKIPKNFVLSQNYPNPFNPVTTLRYDLPQRAEVVLTVYDILGHEVARLVDAYIESGYHQTRWNGRDAGGQILPSGIYIARLTTSEYTKSIKMVLLK